VDQGTGENEKMAASGCRLGGDFIPEAFLGRTVSRVYCANTSTIVQRDGPVCTMLRFRNHVNNCDFALPIGTIVHSIHCAYHAFLNVTY